MPILERRPKMEFRPEKSIVALFVCLAALSVLMLAPAGNKDVSLAQSEGSEVTLPQGLVELVDAEAFIGPMENYEYDLYNCGPGGVEYVAPPELDYKEIHFSGGAMPKELDAATGEVEPASREITISLWNATATGAQECQPVFTVMGLNAALNPLMIKYCIEPATKTVLIEVPGGGVQAQEVSLLPDAVDFYVAVQDPLGRIRFLDRVSILKSRLYNKPVKYWKNQPIQNLQGILIGALLKSNIPYGYWTILAAMVPPGQRLDANHPETFISNIATLHFLFTG